LPEHLPTPDELILENLGYAKSVAKQIARNVAYDKVGLDLDDCVQLGLVGLTQAAHRFDMSNHDFERATITKRFRSFAYLRIRGAVIDEMRRLGAPKRQRPPDGLSFDHEDGEDLVFHVEDPDEWIDLQLALKTLSRRERNIVTLVTAGISYTELAPKLGLTETQMYQTAKDIRLKLSTKMGMHVA